MSVNESSMLIIRASLKQIVTFLPLELCDQAKEFIDHNEFLLAWEAMEGIADDVDLKSADFWRQMAKTAILMVE